MTCTVDMDEGGNSKLAAAQRNGTTEPDIADKPNGEKNNRSDSESDADAKLNDDLDDVSVSISKSKNPMADLEQQANTEAMDMDTGDDSDGV